MILYHDHSWVSYFLVVLIIASTLYGAVFDGIRTSQYLFLLVFIALSVVIVIGYWSEAIAIIYSVVLLLILLYNIIYGEGNLKKIKIVGPFQVGHQDWHLTNSGIAASVYYPMDRKVYAHEIKEKGRNTHWLRYGNSSLTGLAKATADIGSDKHLPPWFYQYLKKIKMNTVQNGTLAADFWKGSDSPITESLLKHSAESYPKKLIPIVFLHGLAGSRTTQSGSCRDLASHGYIVFSIDHHDGTAYYSKTKEGSERFWPLEQDLLDLDYRQK